MTGNNNPEKFLKENDQYDPLTGKEHMSSFHIPGSHSHWLGACYKLPALSWLPFSQGNMLLIRYKKKSVNTARSEIPILPTLHSAKASVT
jgi:hypothetical protein